MFGLRPEDFGDTAVGVWPDNWQAVQLFIVLSTQWRVGMAGAVGLDYAAVKAVFEIHGVEDAASMLDDIRVMEAAALEEMRKGVGNG